MTSFAAPKVNLVPLTPIEEGCNKFERRLFVPEPFFDASRLCSKFHKCQ